ncbi:MAG: hydrogenase expression/formation protein HypE [Candidatus Omnitrophica bacterium]|nr:hydrogenase expression/formation protein HypE [Candidatus Omnitrophota bacterium]
MKTQKILLGHGSGGILTHKLIKEVFLKRLKNPVLEELGDSAYIDYREKIAFTTDSFVVSPLFFPGGDIGKLAVCGTINDLTVMGAQPEYLSLALIIEEGLDFSLLEKIADSIALTARKAGVAIATGDIKVVERGACDKLFINTAGIGRLISRKKLSPKNLVPGDKVIITGNIGQHGLAVLARRQSLDLNFHIQSDCAALNHLLLPLLKQTQAVKFMRDPTRGGLATTLNEVTQSCGLGIELEEKAIPISSQVRAACELLGIDPLYVANEGAAVLVVRKDAAGQVLRFLKKNPLAKNAKIIATVVKEHPGKVVLRTLLDTRRIVEMLTSEPLPRIC